MDRRVTSPTWGHSPPGKQAINESFGHYCDGHMHFPRLQRTRPDHVRVFCSLGHMVNDTFSSVRKTRVGGKV